MREARVVEQQGATPVAGMRVPASVARVRPLATRPTGRSMRKGAVKGRARSGRARPGSIERLEGDQADVRGRCRLGPEPDSARAPRVEHDEADSRQPLALLGGVDAGVVELMEDVSR
ncbi:MAG: hypothetical protein R3C32_12685 [Chloroflexota bacterium]